MVPRASDGMAVYVGGITAIFDDFAGILTNKLPLFVRLKLTGGAPAAEAVTV